MPKMKDADLRDLVAKRRDASFKHVTGKLARDRQQAMQFYRGDNLALYGDSGDGLSTVVSRDLMEAVESMLPALMKPFVAGDETVRFEPKGPEDEEGAKQATEYVNYLFQNHNDGFRVIYDSLKDGLLFRYGCGKVVCEEVTNLEFESYQNLSDVEVAAINADDAMEIVGDEIEQNPDGTFNLKVQRTSKRMMYRVIVIAPDRFMYEPRIASLDDATFLGDHAEKTVGDLIAMGLPKAKCKALKPGRPSSMDTEDDTRFSDDEDEESLDDDDLARKVWVDECYIRCDYEGDGTLRWRKVLLAGNDNTILENEEADDHPYEGWTPIPEPHKLIGMGAYDLTRDIQMQKTAIKREALNALYLANRPMQEYVEGQVNVDDFLSPSVGGKVRVKQIGQIREIPSGGDGVVAQSLQMIEALDADREARTGVTRYNQGMDANSLNKTATGVSIISNASMQRQELVARQYAESFLKGVFRKLLKLTIRYQDKAQVIRLRGKWVEMDPSAWNASYDMSISVGLGTGNKDQQMAHLTNLLGIQAQIVEGQGGPTGPIVTWENIYEAAKAVPEAMGFKGSEKFFSDPKPEEGAEGQQAPQQPQEDPNAAAAAQAQAEQQAEAERHADELKAKHDTEIEKANIDADTKIRVASIGAVKELVIAGLTIPEAEAVVEAAPHAFNGAPQPFEEPQPALEGDDMSQMMPEDAPEAPMEIDPELAAQLMAQEQGQAPEGPVPDVEL
jgi:hypothetical protein